MDGTDISSYIDQLMNMVNAIIMFTIVLIFVMVLIYTLPYFTRKTSGSRKNIININKKVSSVDIVGEYLTIKTEDGKIYAYSDPVLVTFEDYYPYRGLSYKLIEIGIGMFIINIVLSILGTTFIPGTILYPILMITDYWYVLLVASIPLLIIKRNSLVIELKTGSAARFTKTRIDPATLEYLIKELTRRKREKKEKEEIGGEEELEKQVETEKTDYEIQK
ncbi:MAG: hypothetical protein B6U89_04320 [Desulfurococcales archaeon ex4484_58]|nr:MAG: hypothetical protein B6U89_04320 [Desulfurococcales archaeon ex4484_58]